VDIVIGVPTGPTGSASVTDGKLGNIITGPPTYITAIDTATNTVTLNTSNKVISSAGDNLIFATNVVTLGSNTVRAVDTTGLYSGMAVSGTGIPANTTISFIDSINKTITLSKNAIGNSYGTNLDLKTNVITSGSNSITGADTTGLIVGMAVTDSTDGTALGTITGIDAATHTIALSANAGAGSIGHKLTFDNNIITNASSTISGVDTSNVKVGMVITGVAATGQPGIIIPPGTVVSAISGSSIILSNPVAVSGGATSNAAQLSFGNDTTKQGDTTIYGVDVSNVKVGMIVSGNGIPVGSVVTALDANAKTVTISKPALASAVGVSLTFGSNNTTANSNVVTGVNTDAIAVGAAVSGAGIPANTTVTAIDSVNKTVTLSSQATATASGVSLTFGGAGFQFTDNTGSIRSGTLVVNNGKWTATVAGASNPITGTVTNAATGTVWSQDNSSVNIGGVNQTVKFDFAGSSASNTAVTVTANGFNSSDPNATSNFSNSFVAYDAQGNTHNVNIYYRKISANSWDYHAMIPDATGINGMAGNNVINGSLTFDDTGILTSQSPPATTVNTIKFSGGVPDMSLSLDLGQGKSTQVAFQSQASQTADGNGKGSLLSTTIDEKGYVTATYSNNKTQRIAQLATAKFASMGGLEKAGNSLYRSTVASGTATIGSADLQGSTLFTKSLEQSNVDMATQLVNMIKLQRAYSGNSKTITSSDEMMQETLALKR
jgi:flagellar hook protein FlgE